MRVYVDSSALVKLVQVEPHSEELRDFLAEHSGADFVVSALARVEVVRAVLPGGSAAIAAARRVLSGVAVVGMTRSILDTAATLRSGWPLRSLDAIHLATAQRIGSSLVALATYDVRMLEAGGELGLPVVAPV